MAEYPFRKIEKKWQKYWQDEKIYEVKNDAKKPKYYVLDMFPYPSGAGLHVGHPLGYIASDIVARYKRLRGFNVLHPMGFDSFGLPAEQYAIQTGQHPATTTKINIDRYKEQLKALGFSFDWSREVRTSDPSFYRWTQWIFSLIYDSWYNNETNRAEPIDALISKLEKDGNHGIDACCDENTPVISSDEWSKFSGLQRAQFLLKYRLAYLAETTVNWCPALGTVLSNDEVKDGYSERGGHPVVQKKMPQWSMRITAYADRLLKGLESIDWPEPIKEMQRNWIGKSYGAEIDFQVADATEKITVFTTRIDTLFGVTFMVLAPESELVNSLTTEDQKEEVFKYVQDAKSRSERDRMSDAKNVSGVFTGSYAIHPFTEEKIPVYIADYVLAGYGTGAVMAVPSGDQRDFDFAKHFDLPITIINEAQKLSETTADATKAGKIINSGFLNGLTPAEAINRGIEEVTKRKIGTKKVNFKLRDAIFGRQRYWGEPIPIFYEDEGLAQLLPNENLPLELPEINEYLPTAAGDPPLGRADGWSFDGKPYELSTMPGWAGSSWYFFRYMDPHNANEFCGKKALEYWQDVDFYMGGSEHATGHLLYSRFWTKFLYDRGLITVDEYAKKLVNQGMIQGRSSFVYRVKGEQRYVSAGLKHKYDIQALHVDVSLVEKDVLDVEAFKKSLPNSSETSFELENDKYLCGWEIEKMSKSKYNVVNPDDLVQEYGADTLRMYEMFLGPIEASKPWNTNGIDGVFKFLRKFWNLLHVEDTFSVSEGEASKPELKILHGLIKKVAEDCETLSLNTTVSAFMVATNELQKISCNKRNILEPMIILLSPYAPHIAEELWQKIGHNTSVVDAEFPELDDQYLLEDTIEYPIMVNGKMRAKITFGSNDDKEKIERETLANEKIQKWLEGKAPKKVIVVPKKIVNVVV
ncbi:MAG: leucine--tRNA ligase [Bacteroidota bacterium]